MQNLFILIIISIIEFSLSAVRDAIRNVPLPLLFVGANRHREEFKKRKLIGKIDIPKFKFRSVLDDDKMFWNQPIYKGSNITNDEYMRAIASGVIGPGR